MNIPAKIPWYKRTPYVQVAYRDIEPNPRIPSEGYTFKWTLKGSPEIGTWVIVPGAEKRNSSAVIIATNTKPPKSHTIKAITRLVTPNELAAGIEKHGQVLNRWLNMARKKAGLSTPRVPRKPPGNYPEIPPADGEASKKEAYEYGRVWWRILKAAEEAGRPAEEIKRFADIAHRWYTIKGRS